MHQPGAPAERRRALPRSCERRRRLWAGEQLTSPSAVSAAPRAVDAGRATPGAAEWPPHRQVTPRNWRVASGLKLVECLAVLVPKKARLNFCQHARSEASIIGQEHCGGFCFCEKARYFPSLHPCPHTQSIVNYSDRGSKLILELFCQNKVMGQQFATGVCPPTWFQVQ